MTKHIFCTIIILLLLCVPAYAADHYVSVGGLGSKDGSDLENCFDQLPATLVRGDTYYLVGHGDDSTYVDYTFDDAESGANYIYIKKVTSAQSGVTGYAAWMATEQAVFDNNESTSSSTSWTTISFRTGYWVFDGVAASDKADSSTYGFKVINNAGGTRWMAVGIPKLGDDYQLDHIQISYTAMPGPGEAKTLAHPYTGNVVALYGNAYDGHEATNITATNCYLSGCSSNILIRRWQESVIENCYLDGNFSLTLAEDGIDMHGQQISPGTECIDDTLRNNTFIDTEIYVIGHHNIGYDSLNAGRRWQIYNNQIIGCSGSIGGWIQADTQESNNWFDNCFHHNTFVDVNFSGVGVAYVHDIDVLGANFTSYSYNNLYVDCTNISWQYGATSGGILHDHDYFYNCTFAGAYNDSIGDNSVIFGSNPIASSGTPYNLHLNTDLPCSNIVAISTDADDSTRSNPPDAGSLEFVTGGGGGVSYIYVSGDGNDTTGDGSISTPYLTIAKATSEADSGDVILFKKGGVWRESITFPDSHITVSSYGAGALPVINGHKQLNNWTIPAVADTVDTTITASLNGGYLYGAANADFDVARDATTGVTLYNNELGVGMSIPGTTYQVNKTFLKFVLPIPLNTIILADTLKLFGYTDYSTEDFNIYILSASQAKPTFTTADLQNFDGWNTGAFTGVKLNNTWRTNTDYSATGYNNFILNAAGLDTTNTCVGDSVAYVFVSEQDYEDSAAAASARVRFRGLTVGADSLPKMSIKYTTPGGSGTLAHRVLTGEEINVISVFINGALGTSVAYGNLDTSGEYTISGDSLYVIKADTTDVWISALDFGINTNGQPGSIVSDITIRGFSRGGVLFDDIGFTMSNVLMDSLRMFINVDGTGATFDHITMIGGLFAADSLAILESPITNSIIDSVAVTDTTNGYAGSYNNWHDSGDQPEGTGDTTLDLQLGADGIPDLAYWAGNNDYFGYAYYANGTLTITSQAESDTSYVSASDSITVAWTATGNLTNLIVYFLDGAYAAILDTVPVSDSTYTFLCPADSTLFGNVRITNLENALVTDDGDSTFEIVRPVILITYPNGEETLRPMQTYTITYEYHDVINVKIEYSIDNGANWIVIIATETADGTHSWVVPISVTIQALIKVTYADYTSFYDVSDAAFTIKPYGGIAKREMIINILELFGDIKDE
jgi:hypothetical protein